MEKFGTFFGHFEYITAIWYILWAFGNFVAICYISPLFGTLCREKSGNPDR
jgi:hypothetical protein